INSVIGNTNITSQLIANLIINNIGGQLAAFQGAINIIGSGSAIDMQLLVGDSLSKALNVKVGLGNIETNVDKLEGAVTLEGRDAHLLIPKRELGSRIKNAFLRG